METPIPMLTMKPTMSTPDTMAPTPMDNLTTEVTFQVIPAITATLLRQTTTVILINSVCIPARRPYAILAKPIKVIPTPLGLNVFRTSTTHIPVIPTTVTIQTTHTVALT